jgi:hypothetical protein
MNTSRAILFAIALVQPCLGGARIGEDLNEWTKLCGKPVRSSQNQGMTERLFMPEPNFASTILVTFHQGHAVKAVYTTKNQAITDYIRDKLLERNSTAIWRERVAEDGVAYYETEDGKRTLHIEKFGADGRAIVSSREYRLAVRAAKGGASEKSKPTPDSDKQTAQQDGAGQAPTAPESK